MYLRERMHMDNGNPETRLKLRELIPEGTRLVTNDGEEVIVNALISDSGGQGDVYHATYNGRSCALKWYNKHKDDVIGGDLHKNIVKLCSTRQPSVKFIWPQALVMQSGASDSDLFGYVMELFPDGYAEMNDFLRADNDPQAARFKSYNAVLTTGLNIAAAMRELHVSLGMSYKDLNPKNFAFNPQTGDILVIDNDNVSADSGPCSVSGMNGYMAPEIQRSGYQIHPDTRTDYFSLAVILFRLFFVDHPFEGRRMRKYPVITDKVEEYCYAIKPIFCFDPNDDSNRPDDVFAPNSTIRWRIIPPELRALFVEAFTVGIDAPGRRPPENAWINAISRARDKLIRIPHKRAGGVAIEEQFVNFDDPRSIPSGCMSLTLSSGYRVALYPQKAIYKISVDGDAKRYGELYAGIVYNAEQKCMGIRNLSADDWRIFTPGNDAISTLRKGQTANLVPGMKIEFQQGNDHIVGTVNSLNPKV